MPTDTTEPSSLANRTASEITRLAAQTLAPGLYLVATPIGHLADITLRALVTLQAADVIYCEDTRHSRTLLAHYGLSGRLSAYHEHNAASERPKILARLAAGQRVAVISDAGTPLISDPGFKLVRETADAGYPVISLPGASASLVALTSSGLPTDSFFFAGFLPPRSGQRQTRLKELQAVPGTLIFFEAPQRVIESLEDMLAVLGDRPAVIARELTKLHEEGERGLVSALLAAHAASGNADLRGEIVLLVSPPVTTEVTDAMISMALTARLELETLRDAARNVADSLCVPKARVYNIGLKLKQQ